jgi:NADH-quinone oxidoreductase subunit C
VSPLSSGDDIPAQQEPAADTTTTESAEAAAPVFDERRSPIVDRLREKLGDSVVASEVLPGRDIWVRVKVEAWAETARVCREELGFPYFCFLSAIDWMPSPFGKSEDDVDPVRVESSAPLEQGVTGGDTRFQLLARVESPGTGIGITLKADVGDELVAPTWSNTYAGADWHERETWEMFGITFSGHPNLVHIYLPTEFEGFPLRKDFPLLSRMVKPWPGVVDVEPMPGEDPEESEDATEAAE